MNSVTLYKYGTDSTITRGKSLLNLIYEFGNAANPDQRDEETENEPGPTPVSMNKAYCKIQCLKKFN